MNFISISMDVFVEPNFTNWMMCNLRNNVCIAQTVGEREARREYCAIIQLKLGQSDYYRIIIIHEICHDATSACASANSNSNLSDVEFSTLTYATALI